ncbi:MAG: leucine-rich repeat protein [Clostridia bacterium]|nr:leucine-rich repeat protein [Clostridia bacterium]
MKNTIRKKTLRAAVSLLLAVVLLVGTIPTAALAGVGGVTLADKESNGLITKLDGLKVDYSDYLNSDVAFQLPEGVTADDEVSVIISVGLPTVMDAYEATDKAMSFGEFSLTDQAKAVAKAIADRKAEILSVLDEQSVEYTVGEDFSSLVSGFEIVIKAGDYAVTAMSLGKGEKAVLGEEYYPSETKLVENEVDVYETGIFDSSDSQYDGTGMVVAVLDTGLDSNHSAFSVNNFTSQQLGLTYKQVASLLKDTKAYEWAEGLTVDDVYINDKVPFGYDYADNDSDVYSTHNNHGTHVSGVIVGKDDTITGVAPNAQLVSMKIFSDVQDTARSAWILAALEDCVVLGVDVINMSLGTACGFGHESEEELLDGVYDRIRKAGVAVVVAASNSYNSSYGSTANGNLPLTSNPDSGTVGSPGTYDGVLSVGSVNGVETPYIKYDKTIIYFDESNTNAGKENNFFDTLLGDKDSLKAEYVTIPGVGRSADYTGLDVKGKIALVRRGSNTFEEKALIAEAQGAIGIIIYNNVSGEIKMNVGDAKLAVCSISQDDGELLAAKATGKLNISRDQTSGPFMSDFSSWGPTPSLGIKPEITAHGGNILSSVTGGGYDRLSGTSMACPNLAGVSLLLRQYVTENFPDIAGNANEVTAMVNRLMMSTADIIINTNGEPYAVRKQGAGLANLASATETPAYIATYDADGKMMDTTKLELGDDPQKIGVYEMTFSVVNIGKKKLTYEIGAHIITEGVSDTKTNAGETTVTEQAYVLSNSSIEVISVEGGKLSGKKKLSVKAGEEAKVTVRLTLGDEDKAYLDNSFENGMYVEGFITLDAKSGTKIDLSVPYLAFYGDWTVAPLFDLEYYETNADELDDGIDPEDKLMADAYATRPVGGISEDFVSYLGAYYFEQDPEDMVIAANKDYIALSNQEGSVHSLRFVWGGALRGAAKIEISITDDTTGEVVFECVDDDVRKSYGDGGDIRPTNIEIEFDTQDYNLANNSEYTVRLVAYLDYGDGGITTNKRNVFEFPLVSDFEAPTISDVRYFYEYDKQERKNKLFAEIDVYDNHFAMCGQLGYVTMGADDDGNEIPELLAFEQYMTPIYSKKNSTTTVKVELTDYVYQIKDNAINKNSFVFTCYDYTLNYATYEIRLPDDYVDFYFEGLEEGGITLSPNEVFTLEPKVYPETSWAELLEFDSSRPSVARVVNNKIVAVSSGTATIRVTDPRTDRRMTFTVKVLKEGDEGYMRYDKPVADMFILSGYTTDKAYYLVDNEEKDIGETGNRRFFEGRYNLSMFPSEKVTLNYDFDPYFPKDAEVVFESSNESIVTVDAFGQITAQAEGFSSVTVKILQDGNSTYYSESVSIEVKDPYIATGGQLTHYYGLGGVVEVPKRLNLKEIGSFAFSNFEYVAKTPEEMLPDDKETTKQWYIGDSTITKVILPEGIEKINAYAFANLTALEEIVLPSTLTAIEYGAFYGCSSLEKVTFSGENNLIIVNQHAFEQCDLRGTLELTAACVISDYAFAGNKNLEKVVTGDSLLSIGQYAFAGCESLEDVTVTAKQVKYGGYAFTGCEALTTFYVNASVLPEGLFYECENLASVSIGPDVKDIGEFAFRTTKVSQFEVKKGNKTFKAGTAAYILSANGKTLYAVAATTEGAFTAENIGGAEVTAIGKGAFSHNTGIISVTLPSVTKLGDYAFGSSEAITKVELGALTDIGEYAFFETAITVLPAFTADTEIGRYAFAFTDITSVTVPDEMEIAEGVFSECEKLTTVVIGNDVTIGKYAFGMDKDIAFKVEHRDEDGERYFYYTFSTALKNVTIGNNAVIGEQAFNNAASLEKVTLGEGAEIEKMAFYNAASLKEIDLSKVTKLGDYAFSGDVYYVCLDDQMSVAAVSKEGQYIYTYHGPALPSADLSSVEEIGEYAFAYCRDMVSVKLPEAVEELKPYTFAGCIKLKDIDLSHVETVGEYAFTECESLQNVNLSAAETVGDYAFVYNKALTAVTLNEKGTDVGEGSFSYNEKLTTVTNLAASENIGDYAFAYTALASADLTGAVSIGKHAFMKENYTPFAVVLGEDLETIGDNPFAMCKLEPFAIKEVKDFNGKEYVSYLYDYEISDNVFVQDGALYATLPNGYELISYNGSDSQTLTVIEDTVRVSAMAFVGSDLKMITLPYTTAALGHKAFYDSNVLEMVIFESYRAPILEEEFDPTYYETFTHLPGTGDYGTYTDYDGNEVQINGTGFLPWYMWNSTDGLYSNVFYGAHFKDYVGYVEQKIAMIRPKNGIQYDSFVYGQYFDLTLDGGTAPDLITMAAIRAIKKIPERVQYKDKPLVDAARTAYNKIATIEQQSLVFNYADLISAEQRITALTPKPEEQQQEEQKPDFTKQIVASILLAVILLAIGGALLALKLKLAKLPEAEAAALAEKFGPLGEWLNKKPDPNAEKKPVFAWVKPFFAKCKGWAVTAWSKIREAVKGLFAKKQKPAPTEPEVEEPTETATEETADPEE